jgi:hypothetical protein
MAIESGSAPSDRLHDLLHRLFGEARSRQRRRRRRILVVCCASCAAAAALVLILDPGGAAPTGGSPAGTVRLTVASHTLPLRADYTGLSVAGGQLTLIDYGNGSANTAGGGICQVATIDPHTMRPMSVARGACDDPALFHRQVMEVRQWTSRGAIDVRVATVSARAAAGYTLGPVLFSYLQCSDCWDRPIYGPDSLWIDAPFSTQAGYRATGELFRVSERTGRLLQRWSMPSMPRALLAVDADGLWIAPSIESGGRTELYRVAPGTRTPARVLEIGTRRNPDTGARFLVADRHTVWVETWPAFQGRPANLWQLVGSTVTVRDRVATGAAAACTDLGEGPATVLGDTAMGVYCVEIGDWQDGQGALSQNVFRVSPGLGEQQRIATVKPPPGSVDIAAAAAFDGSYYFLDPPTDPESGGSDSFTPVGHSAYAGILFRVTSR